MNSLVAGLGLIGFLGGFLLYLFIFSIVCRRGTRRALEWSLLALLASLLVWFGGNFVALLLRQMDLERIGWLLSWVDALSFSSLALLPALLFQSHWSYYRNWHPVARWGAPTAYLLLLVLYLPLLMLPGALQQLMPASTLYPVARLGVFSWPFLVLLTLAYYGSALLQVLILRNSENSVERGLFTRLLPCFVLIPLYNLAVFRLPGGHEAWQMGAFLSSLIPGSLVSHYIYRHRFLEIVVQRGVRTLVVVLVTASFYLLAIRRFVLYLETELQAPPRLVEMIFLAAVLLLFPVFNRWLGRHTSSLFSGELKQHRQLAQRLDRTLPPKVDTAWLVEWLETTLARELKASRVRIHLGSLPQDIPKARLYPLTTGDKKLGFLELEGPDAPLGAQPETLKLLATEIGSLLERSRLQQIQLTLERELARKSRLEELGQMAATVAHNVKNPLSSIKTLLQLQRERHQTDSEQRAEIDIMLGEIDRLAGTVSQMLDYSRLEAREESLALSPVNLESLLHSIQSIFKGELRRRQVDLESSVDFSPPVFTSNPEALTDIVVNLLSNALQVSRAGQEIEIEIRRLAEGLSITVTDQGPGIPEELAKTLFEPFVTTRAKGTGLGLSIVRGRASQLGGNVRLKSLPGQPSARFRVQLPHPGANPTHIHQPTAETAL